MPSNPPISSQHFGRTFLVAVSLLAAVAAAQIGGVSVAFFRKMRGGGDDFDESSRPPLKIDVARLMAQSPPPDDPPGLGVDPLSAGGDERFPGTRPAPIRPGDPPDPLTLPGPPVTSVQPVNGTGTARPTPVPLAVFTPKVDPRLSELVEQGKLLRNSGDTAGALVKFRAAAAIDPANPLPIAEQAFTFEKMTLPDKAAEQWRRILGMGDRAGVYYSAAMSKLNLAVKSTVLETGGTGAAIGAGKTLGIGKVAMVDDPDPAVTRKFILNVPIRSRTAEVIAVNSVYIRVLFYEKVNGKDIAKTIANVSNRWASPPVDWREGDSETLEVSYELAAPPARGEKREYHGYMVRLYYRGELQDTQAEPASLLQRFPPPNTLSE